MVNLFRTVVCEAGEGQGGGVKNRVATASKMNCKHALEVPFKVGEQGEMLASSRSMGFQGSGRRRYGNSKLRVASLRAVACFSARRWPLTLPSALKMAR